MRQRQAARFVRVIVACGTVLATGGRQAVAQDRPLSADFPEVYRAGGLHAPAWAYFEDSSRAAFDGAGNLYVLDTSAGRVVVIDPQGQLVRVVGRKGQGPGEFHMAMDLAVWRDGRMAVSDLGHGAYQVFSPDGELERFVRMGTGQGPMAMFTGMRLAMRPDPLADAIVAQGASPQLNRMAGLLGQMMGDEQQDEAGVDDRGLERLGLDGEVVSAETVLQGWSVPQEESTGDLSPRDLADFSAFANMMGGDMFFAPGFHWDVLPDGTIAYADSSAYAIKLATSAGVTIDVLQRSISPERVTQRMREGAVADALREFEAGMNDPRVSEVAEVPGMEAAMEAMREAVADRESFDEVPVVSGLRATWEGGLWVQRRGERAWEDDGPIDVFTPDREYVGTFAASEPGMPAAFGPDGRVLYWETDELDVPTIVVKRLPAEVR